MLDFFMQLNPVANGIIVIIALMLIAVIVLTVKITRKYNTLQEDLLVKEHRDKKVFKSDVLNKIITDYKAAVEQNIVEINTQSIIEKNFNQTLKSHNTGERFIEKSTSIMVILGLVGTFYGLTLSIGELVSLLTSTSNALVGNVESITGGLLSSIQGMSVAFATSLVGISSSIIVTIFRVFFNIPSHKDSTMVYVEEYLDNSLAHKSVDFAATNDEGKTTFETSIENLTSRLDTNFEEITKVLSYRLTSATAEMASTAEAIQGSVQMFDQSLKEFAENTRDFSEFNHHLKNNIQRMSLSFDDFTSDMQKNSQEIRMAYEELNKR